MKHAGTQALERLSDLLGQIRQRQGLKEKTFGVFYRNSRAFLHFHEDPAGLFADIRSGDDFDRYPVNTLQQCESLLAAIDSALKEPRR
jgi:hypothetical protein